MFFFFFQAEDGIRDLTVTGVQTCALPIYPARYSERTYSAGILVFATSPECESISSTWAVRTARLPSSTISVSGPAWPGKFEPAGVDRKSTRLNSSHSQISYAVFCLKKKKN